MRFSAATGHSPKQVTHPNSSAFIKNIAQICSARYSSFIHISITYSNPLVSVTPSYQLYSVYNSEDFSGYLLLVERE